MTRTRGKLADGREILYFDRDPGRREAPPDLRDLTPSNPHSELRHDELQDEWVIVASHRQERTFLPPADECPLCPSREGRLTEIPAPEYEVVVFENRFPSLLEDPGPVLGGPRTRPGRGRCEVICFSSDHDTTFSRLPADRLGTIAEAIVDRTRELAALPGVEHVLFFENRGEEIGVTLSHPHGQIYAYPFPPPRIARSNAVARRVWDENGTCVACSALDFELEDRSRVVDESERFVAFVPYAARWPYEVRLMARSHVPDLESLDPPVRLELLSMEARVLAAFDTLFPTPMPYIASLIQGLADADRDLAHLRLDIVSARRAEGKLKYLAGSETVGGAFINDIRPEAAADALRAEMSGSS